MSSSPLRSIGASDHSSPSESDSSLVTAHPGEENLKFWDIPKLEKEKPQTKSLPSVFDRWIIR